MRSQGKYLAILIPYMSILIDDSSLHFGSKQETSDLIAHFDIGRIRG